MGRRALIVMLVAAPAAALGVLGIVVVASATAHQSTAAFGAPTHYASRQAFAVVLAALVAIAFVELGPRRLLRAAPIVFPCAALAAFAGLAPVLGRLASRVGHVSGRMGGFLAPEPDRRGKGYEVLALARAPATATPTGVGLGRGTARRHLSSPGSDYVFAVVTEELGRRAAGAVIAAWLAIGAGALLAARGTREPRLRAAALG